MISQFFRNALTKITPYIPGKSIAEVTQSLGLTDVIKMASNENPLGCPIKLNKLAATFKKIHFYPHQESAPLIQKLSEKFGVSKTQIILGNGSDEILQMIGGIFLNPGDEILTSKHTFSVYRFVAHFFDASVIEVPTKNHEYDLEGIAQAVTLKTRIIFIANPNNPTGTIKTHEEIETLLQKLDPTIIVVLDEAYAEYVESPQYPQSMALVKKYSNVIVLRTFSKLYGLAGLRVGYGIGSKSIIETMQKIRQPFNLNSLALKAAELALDEESHIKKSLILNQKGKLFLYKQLDKLGLKYLKTEANFICIFLPIAGKEAMEKLLLEGIIIRPLESFKIENAIRVTIGTMAQNKRFIAALSKILSA
jgi:histidinol-phosphate aminotransferase